MPLNQDYQAVKWEHNRSFNNNKSLNNGSLISVVCPVTPKSHKVTYTLS